MNEYKEHLQMLEQLLEEDEWFREKLNKNTLANFREATLAVVSLYYPELKDLAEQMLSQITDPDIIRTIYRQLLQVPDQKTAHFILTSHIK